MNEVKMVGRLVEFGSVVVVGLKKKDVEESKVGGRRLARTRVEWFIAGAKAEW